MSRITHAVLTLALVGAGMFGLHAGIQYSGWVLFVGLLVAIA